MKILAIDDNPDNLTALRAVMADRLPGTAVLTALNGLDGLELAQSEDPDAILLDIVMPGMDGYAVCRTLKEDARLQLIPVLFLTALKTDRESRVKALEVGAEGFLSKPFDEIELVAQIRAMAKIKGAAILKRDDRERLAELVAEHTRALQQGQAATLNLLEDLKAENEARKMSEGALRESEEQFRLLFNSSRDAVFVHEFTADRQPGRFVEANAEACRRYGYTHDELLRMLPTDLDAPEGLAAIPAAMHRLTADGHCEWEGTHITRNGRRIDVEIVNVLFQFRGRQMILATVRDITGRKRADAELQKMQKLQSVGTLAGGIAHDFNNILMGLFGNISLARSELGREHPAAPLLDEAEKSMNRAVRLTTQLLTFAKGGDPVKEDVSLGSLVEEVARFDLSGSQVKLVFRQAEELWMVDADKGQLQQVVSNLTINARQAMPDGGSLYITLENAGRPETEAAGLRQRNYVKVTVRDEGVGIDPKHLNRIFDPYYTTKQTGSGLGLATVYSIIHKHGGHIGVVSEVGAGTAFTFYLPASECPQRGQTREQTSGGPPLDRPARVLVMDDEESLRKIIVRMLASCGYAVVTVPGGREAVAAYRQAREAGAPFDAVIMDLTIPGGMGGKEALKALLQIDPQVRAIVSSGYADDPVMANYAGYGFKGFVAKPYTLLELRDVLAQVLK